MKGKTELLIAWLLENCDCERARPEADGQPSKYLCFNDSSELDAEALGAYLFADEK